MNVKQPLAQEVSIPSINEQIEKALDGRTQRWLSFETRISEHDISAKLKGKKPWKEEELQSIEERLNFTLIRSVE